MPLSEPASRHLLHNRTVQCWGYRRADGLWDIEGRMVDTKTYAFPNEDRGGTLEPGDALHDMWIRLTVDSQFRIHDIEARTDGSPFSLCPAITDRYRQLIGVRIGPGWSLKLRELFAGINGCTHMTELLGPVATTMFQTLYGKRYDEEDVKAPEQRSAPPVLNTCHALASTSPVVKKRWPRDYTGSNDHSDVRNRPLLDDCIT
ncbi:MAG: DUF2889 domain-containing protein [Candidatus Competibacteraceae bacterium]|nr:DUF2889 domain-containing protein [Candidatus Competibacteraceae bacterium]MBK7983925.1 DUF2889 domain-containing protein [Candidatus Competibacteraceae bacterium]MBK8897533.1 DUF2889 domain-containing protein [Candidatus Competibacteraceae bacterium]MBK8963685.1 DUF2889 domain-containing protein [Candidatus Competibacteraceae bacterium]MBK9950575.1 DUF2889 domain-containing protein [Candidatus Competibacteraceae bacterium]